MEEKLKCEVCGALVTRKSASQKYCAGCRAEANSFKAKLHREERKAIEIVQRWSDEHPQKTYLSECLRLFPNILLDNDGTPIFCPYHLGFMSMDDCRNDGNCSKCWNQPVEESESK